MSDRNKSAPHRGGFPAMKGKVEPFETESRTVVPRGATTSTSIASRTSHLLARQFTPVPLALLQYAHRLIDKRSTGLDSTETLLLIHILSYKWTDEAPYPSVSALAERMGLSERRIRQVTKALEDHGLLEKEHVSQKSNRYHLDGLFHRLEEMILEEEAQNSPQEYDDYDEEDIPF